MKKKGPMAMKEELQLSTTDYLNSETIEKCIYNIRGQQVMLDSDVAFLFGIEVRKINQQMKRNIERFPDDFCFQLNSKEFKNLTSQNVISNSNSYGGRRYNPYVYTEQGIIALAGVIKNDFAVQMSIKIVRVFNTMRRFIIENEDTLLGLAKLQNRQITFEIETNKRFDEVIKLIDKKELPKQTIFFDGQYYDAYEFVSDIIRKAKISIILIDPYCDARALTLLKNRNDNVYINLIYSSKSKISLDEINIFESQYGVINKIIAETIHDRFLVIDRCECYSLGTSLNYMGKKTFGINKIEDIDIIKTILLKVGL